MWYFHLRARRPKMHVLEMLQQCIYICYRFLEYGLLGIMELQSLNGLQNGREPTTHYKALHSAMLNLIRFQK